MMAEYKPLIIDLKDYSEVRIENGMQYVATTPDMLVECMAWLLSNVDTDTIITKNGVEVDE